MHEFLDFYKEIEMRLIFIKNNNPKRMLQIRSTPRAIILEPHFIICHYWGYHKENNKIYLK